jgi:hypothetical protein
MVKNHFDKFVQTFQIVFSKFKPNTYNIQGNIFNELIWTRFDPLNLILKVLWLPMNHDFQSESALENHGCSSIAPPHISHSYGECVNYTMCWLHFWNVYFCFISTLVINPRLWPPYQFIHENCNLLSFVLIFFKKIILPYHQSSIIIIV